MLLNRLQQGVRYPVLALIPADASQPEGQWVRLIPASDVNSFVHMAMVALQSGAYCVAAFEPEVGKHHVVRAVVMSENAPLHLMVYGERSLARPEIGRLCRECLAWRPSGEELARAAEAVDALNRQFREAEKGVERGN